MLAFRLTPTGGFSVVVRHSDPFQKLHFGVKMKDMEVEKKPQNPTYLGTCPAGKSREVGEVVKVRRSALRSEPTAQQPFGPKEHRPCNTALPRSTDPFSPCLCCPTAAGCPGEPRLAGHREGTFHHIPSPTAQPPLPCSRACTTVEKQH